MGSIISLQSGEEKLQLVFCYSTKGDTENRPWGYREWGRSRCSLSGLQAAVVCDQVGDICWSWGLGQRRA